MGEFLVGQIGSALRVFVGAVLAAVFLESQDGSIDVGNWPTWVAAGIAVAVPILIAWLNPADDRFGRVAPTEE